MGTETHRTSLVVDPLPEDVEIGSDVAVNVKVWCASGCSLDHREIRIVAGDQILSIQGAPTPVADGETVSADALFVTAPDTVGEHSWQILFPCQTIDGVEHDEASASIAFRTKPHGCSLAVWDLPSFVIEGQRVMIKVGARSSGARELRGARIDIRDDTGSTVASGTLGDTAWPGTSALYWANVDLVAPNSEGVFTFSALFTATDVGTPHRDAAAVFSVRVVKAPQHVVTVMVVDKETGEPISRAVVRLGPYRGATDQSGLAQVSTPTGTYDLLVWKPRYITPRVAIDVSGDITVPVTGEHVPKDDPWGQWI